MSLKDNIVKISDELSESIMKLKPTQFTYKSRLSKTGEPKLFIVYLPTHTGNNNINQLQITLKRFIKQYKLWNDYNIEYSNSTDDTSYYKEKYNDYNMIVGNMIVGHRVIFYLRVFQLLG